ncbi:MAG: cytochrome c oxidase accessory protein CcoG [Pseudomonadota bacterium]|nr:cytochrome c oxidase accessory protein CcoG [Pseudomonadota bacterium]
MKVTPLKTKATESSDSGQSMYAAREKIYPREVSGLFQNLRKLAVIVVLGAFYTLCWIPWGDRQAMLFDLPARRFHIFWFTFYPQDFFYLAALLVLAAVALLFFTSLAGRLWCGYTCPQTMWTEIFLWMERWTEGPRAKRIKLDKGPWTREKIVRKTSKQFLWITFSLWTGFTFVGYFTPVTELWHKLLMLNMGPWETFWVIFYGFATYGNAGFMREQVCMYMCPYARFQSAMFDRDTLVISYDQDRGEPRGSRRRGSDPQSQGLGDCIDCTLCVQVCPTGIDIRDGLQYECIGCASCIDVCDQVMDRMGYPRGLVRYTTENAVDGKPTRIIRPRTVLYGLILALGLGATTYSILNRPTVSMDVIRDRNTLYRVVDAGWIENGYLLKVNNRTDADHTYQLSASGIEGILAETDPPIITIRAGAVEPVPARVRVPPGTVEGPANIVLTLESIDAENTAINETTRFIAPVN